MSFYSIKDLEQLSGIKAHTLRIWEQRYQFIKPKRTDTNIRYYDDNDLKLILNVALLKENGFKISKIANMDHMAMQKQVIQLTERSQRYPEQIHALTLTMLEMDEERFEKIMATNILKLGFESTMLNIIFPFFSKLGLLWQAGSINPAQEHFISNLIRQKLIVAIDGQYVTAHTNSKKFLLFLPSEELHELTILFANYLIKSRNHKVLYLGQNLPFEDLRLVYDTHKPDYMLSVFTTSPDQSQVEVYVEDLSLSFPQCQILLTGSQILSRDIRAYPNVHPLYKIEDLSEILESIKAESVHKLS